MVRARIAPLTLALLLPTAALAEPVLHVDPSIEDCEVRFAPELTQQAFHRFVREFGSVSAFKQGAAPATLGRWGVSVDVEDIFFTVDEEAPAWNDTFVHPAADHWLGADKSFPKLRLRLGVSDDVEVGAFFTKSPKANYGWLGVEAKAALLAQRGEVPVAVSVRGAYTRTLFVADLDMHAFTADLSVGRTFWGLLTPYLAVGGDTVIARETSAAVDLKNEAVFVPHAAAGLEARYGHVAVGAEVQVSAITTYQAQVSAVF